MFIKLEENGINDCAQIDPRYYGSWNTQKVIVEVLSHSKL